MMNPLLRAKEQLQSLRFVDGAATYAVLANRPRVYVSLSSYWYRETALQFVIEALSPHVDHIFVFLNGYNAIPRFLLHNWITVAQSQDHEDVSGDAGRFLWAAEIGMGAKDKGSVKVYHFTGSDSHLYPPDYVSRVRAVLDAHDKPLVVGLQGVRVMQRSSGSNMYDCSLIGSSLFHGLHSTDTTEGVHVLDTSAVAYRVQDLTVSPADFKDSSTTDIQFGLLGQKQKIPFRVLGHTPAWVPQMPGTINDPLFETCGGSDSSIDSARMDVINANKPWNLLTYEGEDV
jgi:hypothetical protein